MKKILHSFFLAFLLINCYKTFAEGTKELEPHTTGVSKLQAGDDRGFNIATYTSPADKRYYIHINDPSQEMVYFGFGKTFDGSGAKPCFFRIKDPNGNIVVPETQVPTTGQGYIATKDQVVLGPQNLGGGASGYNPLNFQPTVKGDYYIEFRFEDVDKNNRVIFEYLDITVANTPSNSALNGRLWAYQWNLYSMRNGVSMPTYAKFFVYTTDQVVTRLDLNGMEPMSHVVMCNSNGTTSGNTLEASQKSTPGNFAYPEYRLFLNDPDSVAYPSYINPLKINNVVLNGCNSTGTCQGIGVYVSKKLSGEIFLDIPAVPGGQLDGIYTPNSRDKLFTVNLDEGDNCVPWAGLDGEGSPVQIGEAIGVYTKILTGLTNFPIFDPEANVRGIKVKLIRPVNQYSQNPVLLYWDDSKIGGTIDLNGCSSYPDDPIIPGCHLWPNPLGDNRTMNTWWNVFNIKKDTIIHFTKGPTADAGGPFPVCSKYSTIKLGTPVTENNGDTYLWRGLFGQTFNSGTSNSQENILANPTVDLNSLTIKAPDTAFYELTVSSQGCIAKDTAMVIIKANGKANISGPMVVCPGAVTIPYVVKDSRAAAWEWEIVEPNTALVSADYLDIVGIGDSIEIDWIDRNHAARTTTIRLISSYPNCPNDTTLYPVKINKFLQTPIPSGLTEICLDHGKVFEYSVPKVPHTTYQWWAGSGVAEFYPYNTFSDSNSMLLIFKFPGRDTLRVKATYTNPKAGDVCYDDEWRALPINVKPRVDLLTPKTPFEVCSEGTIELRLHRPLIQYASNYDFKWAMPYGFVDSNEISKHTPKISLTTNKLDSVKYYITVTSKINQCSKTDSVYVIVRPKPKVEILSSNLVCKEKALDSPNTYSLITRYAGSPIWQVFPANASNPSSGSGQDFTVTWDTSKASLNPYIKYTVPNDGDTSNLCSPIEDTIKIVLKKFPNKKPLGNQQVCISQPEGVYYVKSNGGGNVYEWFAGETLSSYASIEPLHKDGSNDSVKVKWNISKDLSGEPMVGPWWITVRQFGTEDDECFNNDLDTLFIKVVPEQDCDKIGVGVDKPYEFLQNVSISPNPFNSNIELRLDIKKSEKLEIEVLDLTGRKVHLESVIAPAGSYSTNLNLSDLPPGSYMFSIRSHDYSKRFIKPLIKN